MLNFASSTRVWMYALTLVRDGELRIINARRNSHIDR
jgi:hypothetical protein